MKIPQIICIMSVMLLLAFSNKPRQVEIAYTAPAIVVTETAKPVPIIKAVARVKRRSGGVGAFMRHISLAESGHNTTIVNQYGMLGKYQFAPTTMKGILGKEVTSEQFLQDETLQDKAMVTLMRRNRSFLRKVIREFNGQTLNGILVTESGILAGAHLVGPGGVLAYFYPEKYDATTVDRNGTTIENYMKKFAGYSLTEL